jgi:hypothetical protein
MKTEAENLKIIEVQKEAIFFLINEVLTKEQKKDLKNSIDKAIEKITKNEI